MHLEVVPVRETQASRILPKKDPALRVFLILLEPAPSLRPTGAATAIR